MQIPKALQSQQEKLLATKLPFIHIEPYATNEALAPWTSKYCGLPYLPKDAVYPHGTDGKPLALLAQINFAETPQLEGYPTSGILQFFIAGDFAWGLAYSDPYDAAEQFRLQQQQTNFRVIYYPEVIQDLDRLNTSIDLPEFENLPIERPCLLEFSLREELVGVEDYRFPKVFETNFYNFYRSLSKQERDEISEFAAMKSEANKIGGYAAFTQEDIRFLAPPDENWLLLLQITMADHAEIMWGDSGIGNFFIEEKALQALDFSQVLYNWDCC